MAIDFKTFLSCAPHVIATRKPILLRGRHGIGKSEVVYQIEIYHMILRAFFVIFQGHILL